MCETIIISSALWQVSRQKLNELWQQKAKRHKGMACLANHEKAPNTKEMKPWQVDGLRVGYNQSMATTNRGLSQHEKQQQRQQ